MRPINDGGVGEQTGYIIPNYNKYVLLARIWRVSPDYRINPDYRE